MECFLEELKKLDEYVQQLTESIKATLEEIEEITKE